MSNSYFWWPSSVDRLLAFDTARAEDVNGALDSVSTGFDAVDAAKPNKSGSTYTGTHNYTGATVTVAAPSTGSNPATKTYVDAGLALKGALAGQVWTGTHDYTGGILKAASPLSSDHVATRAYVDAAAFSPALPGQTNNAGKFTYTNGTSASWEYAGIVKAALGGGTLQSGVISGVLNNASYTLPDLTTAGDSFGLAALTNATSVPTTVTTSDGWTIAVPFVAGTLAVIQPYSRATAHGTWGTYTMTPPTLASLTVTATFASGSVRTVQLDTNLYVVMWRNGSNWFASAIDANTNTIGAAVTLFAYNSGGVGSTAPALFADSTTTFVAFGQDAASTGKVIAGSVSGTTITLGTVQALGAEPIDTPVKLTNGLYVVATAAASPVQAVSVSGTACTVGAGVDPGNNTESAGWVRLARSSNSEVLIGYLSAGGGASTRAMNVRIGSISGTTITLQAASTGTNIETNGGMVAFIACTEGVSYIAVNQNSTATTGNYYGISVSGTTATLGTVTSRVNDVPVATYASTQVLPNPKPVWRVDSDTVVFGHLATGPYAVSISGTTLTFGASGGPATTVNFCNDFAGNLYAIGASAYDKLSVSTNTITSSWQIAGAPTFVVSDTMSDKAVSYSGSWYAWTLPAMQTALTSSKWLRSTSTTNLTLSGPIT